MPRKKASSASRWTSVGGYWREVDRSCRDCPYHVVGESPRRLRFFALVSLESGFLRDAARTFGSLEPFRPFEARFVAADVMVSPDYPPVTSWGTKIRVGWPFARAEGPSSVFLLFSRAAFSSHSVSEDATDG